MERMCLRGSPEQTLLRLQEGCPSFLPDPVPTDFNSLSRGMFEPSTEDIALLWRFSTSTASLASQQLFSNTTNM